MTIRGDQLIEQILAGGNDSAVSELMSEFFRGYPIDRLSLLLRSDDQRAVGVGAWIASELGGKIAPMINEFSELLGHPSREVRFYILDVVLVGASEEHGKIIASAVKLIRDPDEAVRWKALRFLSNAKVNQLHASLDYYNHDEIAGLVAWLAKSEDLSAQDIITRMGSDNRLTRMFSVAAAARFINQDPNPIQYATASEDQEIKSFAEGELERYQLRGQG